VDSPAPLKEGLINLPTSSTARGQGKLKEKEMQIFWRGKKQYKNYFTIRILPQKKLLFRFLKLWVII